MSVRLETKMTKFQTVNNNNNFSMVIQLKCIEDSSIRTLPQEFKEDFDFTELFQQLVINDKWDKINLPLTDYNLKYDVEFADVLFTAKLDSITAVNKKRKKKAPQIDGAPDGDDIVSITAEYVLNFTKEVDNNLDTKISLYLNRKEVDEEGKMYPAKYQTILTKLD